MNQLSKYLKAFNRIRRAPTEHGKAPHKIILLLSLLQYVRNTRPIQNQFYISPELILLFKSNWSSYVHTHHVCNFALPFWHLKNDQFWHLHPKSGFEGTLLIKKSVSSLNELNATVSYGRLDADLFHLMTCEHENRMMEKYLVTHYFPDFVAPVHQDYDVQLKIFDELEDKILSENPAEYAIEIKQLLDEKNEEEVYLRGCIFKRQVPKIYDYTCSITSHRIETISNITMIDACHIRPFSESFDDTISNGIALCPNLHRAFDRGLISVDADYKVLVSNNFHENRNAFSLRGLEGIQILLPADEKFYPSQKNLEWHRTNVFKS